MDSVIRMADEQSLGKRLQLLRKKRGLTQEKLAEMILVSRETIRNWESDRCEPSCCALTQLSALYHVSADYILGISDTRVIRIDHLSPDQIEMITILIKTIEERMQKTGQS